VSCIAYADRRARFASFGASCSCCRSIELGKLDGHYTPPATDRMLIFGHRHLQSVLCEHVDHHNSHRPYRSLEQASPLGQRRHRLASSAHR